MLRSRAVDAANQYAKRKGIAINVDKEMGGGTDGWVWESYRPSAIKVLERQPNYSVELACYQRFEAEGLQFIRGFRVPQLIDFSHDLQIVEMSIVNRPFLLDFAKCHLDTAPEFSEEKWLEWNELGIDRFGANRWKEAKIVVSALKRFGVYYYDMQQGNLMFADSEHVDDS